MSDWLDTIKRAVVPHAEGCPVMHWRRGSMQGPMPMCTCDEIDKLRAALRAQGPCAAVSYDGLHCERPVAHTDCPGDNHVTRRGAHIFWPDSEADPEKTAEREARIMDSLLNGFLVQRYREKLAASANHERVESPQTSTQSGPEAASDLAPTAAGRAPGEDPVPSELGSHAVGVDGLGSGAVEGASAGECEWGPEGKPGPPDPIATASGTKNVARQSATQVDQESTSPGAAAPTSMQGPGQFRSCRHCKRNCSGWPDGWYYAQGLGTRETAYVCGECAESLGLKK